MKFRSIFYLGFTWVCDLPEIFLELWLAQIFLGLWSTWNIPGSLTYLRFPWFRDLLKIFLGLWPSWSFPGSVTYLRFSWVCWMGVFWSSVLESWSWNLMSCSLSVVSWSIHDNNSITTVYCHICIMYLIHVFYVLTKALHIVPFVFVPHEAINC